MDLKTPIKEAGSIYKKYAGRLEKLGINNLEDFLYHVPFRYEDFSIISKIGEAQAGETVTIQGTVIEIKNEYTKRWKRLQKAKVADETGTLDIIWFNQPYLINVIRKGDKISLSGKVDWYLHKLLMQTPEFEIITNGQNTIHTGRLIPVYPETRGVSSKWLRRQIYKTIKEDKQNLIEYFPDSIIENNDLMGLRDSIEQVHFPKTISDARKAKHRLTFDELFFLNLSSIQRRSLWGKNLKSNPFSIAKFKKNIEEFWAKLPFTLTSAQQKAVREIFADLAGKKPMNRLLEGDVGSGKTVVSAIAMYLAHLNGFQSVLMAPTEILAHQHFNTISTLLSPLGLEVGLRTASNKKKLKFDILIGTHALIHKGVDFENLGL